MTDLKRRLLPMEDLQMPELWADIEQRRPGLRPGEPESGRRRVGIVVAALVIGAGAVALAVAALTGGTDRPNSSPTIAPPLAQNGVIAYGSISDEGLFWTVHPDGSHLTAVQVDVPGFVGVPSWSPDGTRIAFTLQSNDDPHPEGGNYDIYTANADGSDPVRLTRDQNDRGPEWSPDGTKIAYVRESSTLQIWVMNADGSGAHRLTQGGDAVFPSWSPSGSQIAFVSWDGIDANIYVMRPDGSDVRRLTDDPSHEDRPSWSPDGRLIAFTSEGGTRDTGIYTVAPDGTGVSELLSDPDPANLGFAWSPDGASMAVVGITGPGFERTLSVLDIATGELTAIADPGAYVGPSWQPLQPTGSEAGPAVDVASWDETYILSSFEIGTAPTGNGGQGDPVDDSTEAVGVRFANDWSGDVYPGLARCRIDVASASGSIVGSADIDLVSLLPHGHPPSVTRVSVTGDALTATGSCGPGTRPTGDYRFSNVTIDGTTAHLTVSWGSGSPPDAAWCRVTSELADGTNVVQTRTVYSSQPRGAMDVEVPSGTIDVRVQCEPYTDQGVAVESGSG